MAASVQSVTSQASTLPSPDKHLVLSSCILHTPRQFSPTFKHFAFSSPLHLARRSKQLPVQALPCPRSSSPFPPRRRREKENSTFCFSFGRSLSSRRILHIYWGTSHTPATVWVGPNSAAWSSHTGLLNQTQRKASDLQITEAQVATRHTLHTTSQIFPRIWHLPEHSLQI